MMGPKQFLHRKSCKGVELRFRINPDCAWMTIQKPGCGRELVEIADEDLARVKARFDAIGDDPGRFADFVEVMMQPSDRLLLR